MKPFRYSNKGIALPQALMDDSPDIDITSKREPKPKPPKRTDGPNDIDFYWVKVNEWEIGYWDGERFVEGYGAGCVEGLNTEEIERWIEWREIVEPDGDG